MLQSMTGFGRGESESDGYRAIVEVKSVNGRFCEVRTRTNGSYGWLEQKVQAAIKKVIDRGKVDVRIEVKRLNQDASAYVINEELAQSYVKILQRLNEVTGLNETVSIDQVLKNPDILYRSEDEEESGKIWASCEQALSNALKRLVEMRATEGETLAADLNERLRLIEVSLADVEANARQRVEDGRTRLHERLQEVLGEDRIDRDRLEFEIALLAEKLDVTEECVRLHSHIAQFKEAMEASKPSGRRLNFLMQEMNREVNTIGSKSNDADMAHRSVTMKEELERVREQIQNVE